MKSSGNVMRVLGVIILAFGLLMSFASTATAVICILLGGLLTVKGGNKICQDKGIEPKPIFRRKWIYVVAVIFVIGIWGQSTVVPIESMTLENLSCKTIDLNDTQEISISVQPEDASISSLKFYSSDESVLRFEKENIDGNTVTGKIIPVGEGSAKIHVTTSDGSISTKEMTIKIVDQERIAAEQKEAEEKAKLEEEKKAAEEKAKQEAAAQATASATVDSIAKKAKEAAKTASDSDLKTAYTYIHDTYTDCFGSNDVMEQMMYYGWLMEYAYEGNQSMINYYNVGQDAEQLVKYVYRGTEKPEDTGPQENIRQIKESIEKIDKEETKQEVDQNPDDSTQTPSTSAVTPADNGEDGRTVYYTRTGSKYHYENPCGRGTYYPCTLAEAKARGLEPCGKCVLH